MRRLFGMLMLGATGRNSGKTELACAIIRKFSDRRKITGIKVTTVREKDGMCPRGGKGCGVCTSLEGNYCITEENGALPEKDTSRLLAAGAQRVLWLRVLREHLAEALDDLLAQVGPGATTICESNSLRLVAEPDLFLMVKEKGNAACKTSAQDVLRHVDREVLSDGESFNLDLDELALEDGRWVLRDR